MCSSADTRATPNDFASGRCGLHCHGFCAELAVAHKLRQLSEPDWRFVSRETSASFGVFHFYSPSLVCESQGVPTPHRPNEWARSQASERTGAPRREWQPKRDVSSSLDAIWELRFQQLPKRRELMLYVNHV
jgi:hypothetical protein